jgi:hypothetical protein
MMWMLCHLWKSQPWNHQHWQPADVPAPSQLYKLLTQQYFGDQSIFPCKLEYPRLSIENSLELPQLVLASLPLPWNYFPALAIAMLVDTSSLTTIIGVFLRCRALWGWIRTWTCQNLTLALPQEFADFRKLRTVLRSCGPTLTYECW